ncbi:aminoglycoside 6-adenylyltransferase [Laceyella sacchari]|uniref:aminoglycoside 6-adenylyltransferase n=1 Tax=Laceyella sacchari TaxID=37482 RepID=UPI0035C662E4
MLACYDISYFVTGLDSFKENDFWLDAFGHRLLMKKPEDLAILIQVMMKSLPRIQRKSYIF